MSARRKRVISTEEIQFNHKPAKMLLTEKKKAVSQNGQTPSIIGICSYCVLDRPEFERCQTLLHPELTPWWSFLLADGAHHKKPHSPTHPHLWDWSIVKIISDVNSDTHKMHHVDRLCGVCCDYFGRNRLCYHRASINLLNTLFTMVVEDALVHSVPFFWVILQYTHAANIIFYAMIFTAIFNNYLFTIM